MVNQNSAARFALRWQFAFLLAAIAFALTVQDARADPPVIEGESVSEVTETSAVLHAQLNTSKSPDGAYYQFQLVEDPSEYRSEVSCPEDDPEPPDWQCFGSYLSGGPGPEAYQRQPGDLPTEMLWTAEGGQNVSLDLSAVGRVLEPNTTYHYRVVAVERVEAVDTTQWLYPPVYGSDQTFFTGPENEPPGETSEGGVLDVPDTRTAPLPPATSDDPPLRRHRHRCHRRQGKLARQKQGIRSSRLLCSRVWVGSRTRL